MYDAMMGREHCSLNRTQTLITRALPFSVEYRGLAFVALDRQKMQCVSGIYLRPLLSNFN